MMLLAGDGVFLVHATTARPYVLLMALSLWTTAEWFLVFVRRRRGRLVFLIAALVATAYTHYWWIYLAVALTVATGLCAAISRDRSSMAKDASLVALAGLALYLPWVPSVLAQIRTTAAPWSVPASMTDLGFAVMIFAGGFWGAAGLLSGAAGLLSGASIELAARLRTPASQRVENSIGYAQAALFVGALVGLAAVWLVNRQVPNWALRYCAALFGPLVLGLVSFAVRDLVGALVASVLVVFSLASPGLGQLPAAQRDMTGTAVGVLPVLKRVEVVVSPPDITPLLRYYLGPRPSYFSYVGFSGDPTVADWRNLTARLQHADPAQALRALMASVTPGALIVEVGQLPNATWRPGPTAFSRLRVAQQAQWAELMRATPHLQLLWERDFTPKASSWSAPTVQIDLFQVR